MYNTFFNWKWWNKMKCEHDSNKPRIFSWNYSHGGHLINIVNKDKQFIILFKIYQMSEWYYVNDWFSRCINEKKIVFIYAEFKNKSKTKTLIKRPYPHSSRGHFLYACSKLGRMVKSILLLKLFKNKLFKAVNWHGNVGVDMMMSNELSTISREGWKDFSSTSKFLFLFFILIYCFIYCSWRPHQDNQWR